MEEKRAIKNPRLWAGLNKPCISLGEADIVIFSAPHVGLGSEEKDVAAAIRDNSCGVPPTTESFESFSKLNVLDLGDAPGDNKAEIYASAEQMVFSAVTAGKFFMLLGTDRSVSIPAHRALNRALDGELGIIHFGAGFGLCETKDGDKLSGACVQRRALELEHVSGSGCLFFIGVRSMEIDEMRYYYDHSLNMLTPREISDKGIPACLRIAMDKMSGFDHIYLSVGADCLDPCFAAGTDPPHPGGLSPRELLDLLRGIFELPVVGMDIVGAAHTPNSVFTMRKVTTECFGHFCRKNGLLDTYKKKMPRRHVSFEEPDGDGHIDMNV